MRKRNLKWYSRKSGSCSDIHDFADFCHIYCLHTGKTVQEMLYQHFLKLGNTSQVHDLVFFYQIFIKSNKLLFLCIIQSNSKFFTPLLQYFQIIRQCYILLFSGI